MYQIILFLLLFALLIVAVKVALALLLIAGLIFRPKETIGIVTILAIIAGFNAHPLIGTGIVAAAIAISVFLKRREKSRALPPPDDDRSDEQE